jgi:hypothetical protein
LRRGQAPPSYRGSRSAVELQWFAGWHAGASRASWLDEATAYRVSRWPNFGLIRPNLSQIRATALLAATPLTLRELMKRGALSAEDAARTLNALDACGLLAAAERAAAAAKSPTPAPPPAAPAPPGGFASFVRLVRKHLGLGESQ